MARKLNPQGLIEQNNYLFANHSQYKDKLMGAIKETFKKHNIPVSADIMTLKSGGFLSGSSDQFLVVDGGHVPFIAIGAIEYGNYLNVSVYFLVEDNFWNKVSGSQTGLQALATRGQDMISVRNMYAFWNCVVASIEESFANLKFEEVKSGFLGIK